MTHTIEELNRIDDVTLAKNIRASLKAAFPKARFSVRMRRGCTSTISVVVTKAAVLAVDAEWVRDAANTWPTYKKSDVGADFLSAVEAVVNEWNYDKSDTQADYWNVRFFLHTSFADKFMEAQHNAIKALPASARIVAKVAA